MGTLEGMVGPLDSETAIAMGQEMVEGAEATSGKIDD